MGIDAISFNLFFSGVTTSVCFRILMRYGDDNRMRKRVAAYYCLRCARWHDGANGSVTFTAHQTFKREEESLFVRVVS